MLKEEDLAFMVAKDISQDLDGSIPILQHASASGDDPIRNWLG